jgi:hypothetical protein
VFIYYSQLPITRENTCLQVKFPEFLKGILSKKGQNKTQIKKDVSLE